MTWCPRSAARVHFSTFPGAYAPGYCAAAAARLVCLEFGAFVPRPEIFGGCAALPEGLLPLVCATEVGYSDAHDGVRTEIRWRWGSLVFGHLGRGNLCPRSVDFIV